MFDVAGFLALSEKSAFPTLFTIHFSLFTFHYSLAKRSVASVALFGLSIMEMTVAGTAQDLHLIPFYALVETPAHHHIACKVNVNRAKYKEKTELFSA